MKNPISLCLLLLVASGLVAQTVGQPAPGAAAAAPTPQANIRFQFDGMPYSEVLQRFAQMVDKPLISDTNLEGSLTFSDSRPYSYAEALDTLNLILSMKDATLIESGRYLRLVPIQKLGQMPLRVLRGLDQTGEARPGEVLTVVLELKHLDAGEVAFAATNMLSNAGSVAPLSRGRGLVITDRLANIQRIRSLINLIDTESAVERQMKTFTLLHASGAVLSDLINRTFGVSTAPKRTQLNPQTKQFDVLPPDPNDYVTAVFDDASRTLVLFGPRDRVTLAEDLIQRFEEKDGARGGEVRIFYPQTLKAEELARMVREAVPGVAAAGETAATAATKARLIIDATTNRLIVTAPIAGQLDTIEQVVRKIDGSSSDGGGTRSETVQVTRVFRPRTGDVDALAKVITDTTSRRTRAGTTEPTVNVTVEPVTQSVVVTGSPGQVQQVADLMSQLEAGLSPSSIRQTRFIDVGGAAEAQRLAPLVEQIYKSQVSETGPASERASILTDPQSGRLIVTGPADHLVRIEETVSQLRAGTVPAEPRGLRILPLEHLKVDAAVARINELVRERMRERPFTEQPAPSLVADGTQNRLLVTANDAQFEEIRKVVQLLDVAPDRASREMSMISLQAKMANDVLPLINQLLTQPETAQALSTSLPPKLIADPSGRQLIVLAVPSDLQRIRELILKLDVGPGPQTRQFRSIELFGRKAGELLALVQQLYQEQRKGLPEPSGGAATLLAEERNNQLMVSGPESEIARVEAIVRQLDPAGSAVAREETRVIRLRNAVAAELVTLVETSLNSQRQQVKVLLDERSNSLVLTGGPEAVEAAAQIIEQLDTRPNRQPRQVRVLDLRSGDAATVVPIVTELLAELLREQHGQAYTSLTKLVADPAANRIIVTGPAEEIAQVADLVERFDNAPKLGTGTRVFQLRQADATTLAPIVTSAMVTYDSRNQPIQKVSVAPDPKSNSLVVSGSRADLQDVALIIEKLDGQGTPSARAFRIVDVAPGSATQLVELATRLFQAQNQGRSTGEALTVTADPSGDRVIVVGPEVRLNQAEALVATLNQRREPETRNLEVIELGRPNAGEIIPLLTRIYTEQAGEQYARPPTLFADSSGVRLTVISSEEQLKLIKQIVATLEEGNKPAVRQTKMFDVGNAAEVQRLLPLVQQLYQDQIKSDSSLGQADAQFLSDGRLGQIIVSARTDHLQRIEGILSQLRIDDTQDSTRQTRSFDVGSPETVQRLAPLVQQLYQDQWKGRNDPADAQILADAPAGRLIATGRAAHLEEIAVIVAQLTEGTSNVKGTQTRVFQLKTSSASELATTIRTLYEEQRKGRVGGAHPLILPDTGANRLVVSGQSNEVAIVEEIVRTLDDATVQSGGTRAFTLKNASALELASVLSAAFVQFDGAGRTVPRLSAAPDPKSNTILVSGEPKDVQAAALIIEQLDSGTSIRSKRQMRILSVTNGPVTELAAQVRQLFQDHASTQLETGTPEPLILEDSRARQLIVTGSRDQLARIEEIVSQLQLHQPDRAERETRFFDLGRPEEVQRLLTVVQQLYQAQWKGRDESDPADAQFLQENNRLVVTAKPAHLAEITAIIDRFRASPSTVAERETRFLEVGPADEVGRMLPLVQQLYQAQWKERSASDPADAQLLADADNGRLIVTARPEHMKEIVDIFDRLRGEPVARVAETRVYDLRTASASELADTVKTLYQDQVKLRGRPVSAALILPDPSGNRLIVSATTNELAAIDEIVRKLDQVTAQTSGTRVFRVKAADVDQLASMLSSSLATYRPDGQAVPRISVGADAKSRTLIVSGEPKDLQAAAVIIEQLDSAPEPEARTMRIVAVQSGLASQVATQVTQIYQDQLKGRPAEQGPSALILGDDLSNRLILTGSAEQLKLIESIVSQLQVGPTGTGRQLQIFPIRNNSASAVATVVRQLFSRQVSSSDPAQRLVVTASPDDRTLLVEAAGMTSEQVRELIQSLDTVQAEGFTEVRTYQFDDGQADELAPSLLRIFAQRNPAGRQPRFEADRDGRHLMVAATRDQFEQIEEIIRQLQQSVSVSNEIRMFQLENGDATQVAAVVESMLIDRSFRRGPPVSPLRVAPAPALNAVIVQGAPARMQLAEQLIKAMDQVDANRQKVIQTVRLEQADPDDLATAVNQTLQTRPGSGQRVRVTPVPGASSLLLEGPSDEVQRVLEIIKELDNESSGSGIKVRIYKIENGNVREVSSMLEQILDSSRRRSRGGRSGQSATIARDEQGSRLIISGTESAFKLVEQVLPLLDSAPERSDREVEFVWLQHSDATDVVSKVEALFLDRPRAERPLVEADRFSNSITLIGRRSDLVQAQDIIRRLDKTAMDTSLHVRLLPISGFPASEMAAMLQNIYPQMHRTPVRVVEKLPVTPPPGSSVPPPQTDPSTNQPPDQTQAIQAAPEVMVAVDKQANALILSGPSHELDQIERLVLELSFTFISTDAEFRQFPLKEADPVVVARTLTELFKQEPVKVQQGNEAKTVVPPPKVVVVAEPRTRSLIVRARPTDFPLLESLLEQLDMEGISSQLEFRLIPVQHVRPDKLLPLVTQMVTQLSIVRPGEPLTITADTRSRGLLVVGRESIIQRVVKLVESLDTPPGVAEAEVLMISLKQANANQLATVLQTMLKPNSQGEATVDALELQEQVSRLRIQNELGEPVLLDLSKPIKIMADAAPGQAAGANRLILTSTADNLKALAAVVQMMDTKAMIEGVSVKLVALRQADAATVAQTLTSVFQQGTRFTSGPGVPGQPEGEVGKALVSPLNVAIDTRSNSLVLTGQAESIELAVRIIADLDQQLEPFITEVRLFQLKYASASRLGPLLQSVFTEGSPVPGTEGLNTQVTRLRTALEGAPKVSEQPKARAALTIQPDDASNILIVAARTDIMPLIEAVLNGLDIPAASGMDSVRIYPLEHADASSLLQVLNDLYSTAKVPYLRAEDRPNITLDDRTNALIATGNVKAFAFIESLIAQLDRELPVDLRDVRIIPLEKADAVSVASSLQRLLDARLSQKAAQGRSADRLKVLVIGDPRLNSLLVAGSQESFELVQSLVTQLDRAGPGLAGGIRLIPLQHADARTLSTSLTSLFTQRYQNVSNPELMRNRPIIIPDPRSNSLLVAAGLEDNQSLDQLLEQLDRTPQVPSTVISVLALRHHDATAVASTLQNLFAERLQARTPPGESPPPQDRVLIQADPINNALIVSSSQENLALIKGLLEKVDVEPVAEGGLVQAFPLQHADAQRVATMLRSLVDQGLYRPGTGKRAGQRDAMAVTVDPPSNTLIVSASPENLLLIQELIQKIDSADYALDGNIRLYPLKHARASHLATVLDQFFKAKRAAEVGGTTPAPRSLPVSIIADDRTQTLLVTGGKESFDAIDRMLNQLDVEDTLGQASFRVFALKNATATKLEDTLTRLLAKRPTRIRGEPPEPINIIADSWANALIVSATPEDLITVASLIERLDGEQPDAETEVEILPLAKADARRVAETIRGLYRDGAPGTSAPVAINVDERLNAIVVAAGQVDRQRISELVRKLDTDQVSKVSEIKVFPLRFARAQPLSVILNTALNTKEESFTEQSPNSQSVLQFITQSEEGRELITSALRERVLITPDPRMNSLIVSAPLDFMQLLEPIVKRLDAESPQIAKIKVFTLKNADVRQMADILIELFRLQRTAIAQSGSERSVQYTLVRPAEGSTDGSEEVAASAILGTAEETALTVTVDPRTNSLLVGGTEHYVTLAGELIETLDSSEVQERETKVYRLRNASAPELQTALRSFLDQDRQRIISALGPEAIGTVQRMLEREVAIVAEPISNSLLLSASPRYFESVEKLIEELDQPLPQVLIQVVLAEVLLDRNREIGVEWNYNPRVDGRTVFTGTDFGVAGDLATLGGFSSAVTGSDYTFLLRALESDGRIEVLSRPQILTADNQMATINIGQRVPLVTDSRVTERGDTITSFQYQNVGVSLNVTPRISPDGFVKMDVSTTNSALSSSNVDISPGVQVPIINERLATTTVSVQSGQSILIGGLISSTDDTRSKRIPFLGDIPLLGLLFRSTRNFQDRKELLIIMTPQVLVKIQEDGQIETRKQLDQSNIRRFESKRDELQKQILLPLYPPQE